MATPELKLFNTMTARKEALRPLQAGGDGRDGQRRGVGDQDNRVVHARFQVLEQGLLHVEPFDDGLVVDIGLASTALKEIVSAYNYRNLDEVPEFTGKNTTTEFLAKVVFDRMVARIKAGRRSATLSEPKRP